MGRVWRFDSITRRNTGINQEESKKGLYYRIQTRALEPLIKLRILWMVGQIDTAGTLLYKATVHWVIP